MTGYVLHSYYVLNRIDGYVLNRLVSFQSWYQTGDAGETHVPIFVPAKSMSKSNAWQDQGEAQSKGKSLSISAQPIAAKAMAPDQSWSPPTGPARVCIVRCGC
eukprot:SAG31_NODE_12821_length_914_cov_1.105521_1_plen_103_part_00